MISAEELACLFMSYEADEPHVASPDCPASDMYLPRTVEQLRKWLAAEHHGDCVKQAITCTRCVADMAMHKAEWILAEVAFRATR